MTAGVPVRESSKQDETFAAAGVVAGQILKIGARLGDVEIQLARLQLGWSRSMRSRRLRGQRVGLCVSRAACGVEGSASCGRTSHAARRTSAPKPDPQPSSETRVVPSCSYITRALHAREGAELHALRSTHRAAERQTSEGVVPLGSWRPTSDGCLQRRPERERDERHGGSSKAETAPLSSSMSPAARCAASTS